MKNIHLYLLYYLNNLPYLLQTYINIIKQKDCMQYRLNNLNDVVKDMTDRQQTFNNFYHILQRRAKIQSNYAQQLNQLLKSCNEIQQPSKPSQNFLNLLIESIRNQTNAIMNSAKIYKKQYLICSNYEHSSSTPNNNNLKEIDTQKLVGQILLKKKELEKLRKNTQKYLNKYEIKNTQLCRLRLQSIMSVIGNQTSLEKKNNLFLNVSSIEKDTKPLYLQYSQLRFKYKQLVDKYADRFQEILNQLRKIQLDKVILMNRVTQGFIQQKQIHNLFICKQNNYYKQKAQKQSNRVSQQQIIINEQSLQAVKSSLFYEFPDTFKFINNFFTKFQNKQIQDIINYGENIQYKCQLAQISAHSNIENIIEIDIKTIGIVRIFRMIFQQNKQLTLEIKQQFKQFLQNNTFGRKDFILCFQKYRRQNKCQFEKYKLKQIKQILIIYLDQCHKEFDTYNSKQLMVLCYTYYYMQGDCKYYLQVLIDTHPLWQDLGWWQCALLESIYEEVKLKMRKNKNHVNIWVIKGAGFKKSQIGQQVTVMNISFNQLVFYVKNMTQFRLQHQQIYQFSHKYIKLLGFTKIYANEILNICKSEYDSMIGNRPLQNKKLLSFFF